MQTDWQEGAAPIRLARERPFRLGGVQVEPARRQLIRDGRSETLEPRVMQVLVALARAQGDIIGRDELIASCWEGRVVGDNAIQRAVSKVRDLGLTFADGAFQLETITKVGYRMIVPATPDGSHTGVPEFPASVGPAGPIASDQIPHRRWLLAAGTTAAALGGGTAVWRVSTGGQDGVANLIARSEQIMREGNPSADGQGVGFLEEAVALAPGNALAWGRLALARSIMADYAAPEKVTAVASASQEAAGRALALDPRQPDALAAMAVLPPYFGDWGAAERRMGAVLDLHPNHLPTRDARAFFLSAVGRGREGSLDRVVIAAREPLHANHQFRLVYALWTLGRLGEADRAVERALQLWPLHPGVWFARLWTLAFTGRPEKALSHLQEAARPDFPPRLMQVLQTSVTALQSGRSSQIADAASDLIGMVSYAPTYAVNAIMILNALGRIDDAFAVAEAYLLQRGPLIASLRWRNGQISVNDQRRRKTNMLFVPVTAGMRSDPRFKPLMDGIGLSEYWRRADVSPDHLA